MTDEELAATQSKGTRFVKNEQSVLGGQYSGIMKSGKSVELSSDGVVKVPVNATLGSDTKQTATLGTDWVDNGGDSYTASNATSSLSDLSSTSNVPVLINYTISNYSAGDLEGNTDNGDYETVSNDETLNATGFSGDVLINSVKEITQVQGSVTTFNFDTKEFVQVGAGGVGSKELIVNGDFSDGDTGWTGYPAENMVIDNGSVYCINSGTDLQQSTQRYAGKTYTQSFEVISTDASFDPSKENLYIYQSNSPVRIPFSSVGTYERTYEQTVDADAKVMRASGYFLDENNRIDNISIKEALPLSTTYDFKNGTYGVICKLHTGQFNQEDIAAFTGNPELLIEWAFGLKTIPSGITFGSNDRIYFPVNDTVIEYRELNYETTGEKIDAEGTATFDGNSQFGVQDLLLELDSNGVPVSVISPGSVYGEELIDTGFKLYADDGYTIEEELTIAGETNVWAWTSNGDIFKDEVLYGHYDIPAEGTLLQLGELTLDGQIIEKRDHIRVWTYIPSKYT